MAREKLMVSVVLFWIILLLVSSLTGVFVVDRKVSESLLDENYKENSITDKAVIRLGKFFMDSLTFNIKEVPRALAIGVSLMTYMSIWLIILVFRGM